jgi:hypothetical protein
MGFDVYKAQGGGRNMKDEYFYKQSKVKGQIYLQIWRRTEKGEEYVLSLSSAGKCFKKLVSENLLKAQTNILSEIPTTFQTENSIEKD